MENNEYDDDLFEFKGDINYFYKSEYNGKKGLLWGADVTGLGKTKKELLRLKYYYSKQKQEKEFHGFNGYKDIPEELLETLKKHHLAAELVKSDEYRLSTNYPDDFLSLYSHQSEIHSAFYTTDLFIHVYHLLFDNMLQEIEIQVLSQRLMDFVSKMLKALETREIIEQYPVKAAESAEFLIHYFRIAEALLKMAPPLEKYGARFEEPEALSQHQIQVIISFCSSIEQKELNNIMGAKKITDNAPLFGNYCDYSLFKPRGHYTKNQYLQAYFRTMMWFGNRNFDYRKEDLRKSRIRESLLLYDLVKNNKELWTLWEDLFDPISYLIGASENVNLHDLGKMGLSKSQINSFFEDEQLAQDFMNNLLSAKEQEVGNYNPIYDLLTKKASLETPGLRLFSQSFTLDSFIHSLVTAPEIDADRNVSGVDIMAAFGNKEAFTLLPNYHGASDMVVEQLVKTNEMLSTLRKDFWQSNFYNSYLDIVRSITQFDQSENFYYTYTNKWDRKALVASLGAWTELRHDTLLYVKQYGAEAGGFPREPSFRIEKPDLPVQYIEANINFFYQLQNSLIFLYNLLEKFELMLPVFREKIVDFNEVLNLTVQVVEKEVRDLPIGDELNQQMTAIPDKLSSVVQPVKQVYSVYLEESELQKALIADVFTNPSSKEVREVATGRPVRLYVALNNGDGGKRIATGYGYSYYEFIQPATQRLDDEQWKALVYDKDSDLSEKMPLWEKEYLVP
ncbi:MAG: DUF3160 domain-containing protein [Spirochaetales bacterium]|nr:DUF3160 domain-containing protein [Spirochaetales bacterium]